jgi:hypothetical protein
VGSFWAPDDGEFNNRYGSLAQDRMQVAWRGSSGLIDNVGVWIASFVPRKSGNAIASLELESMETGSKWFVIGVTLSSAAPFLPPKSDISTGMPNNWGAGCVTAALLEGLAGIEDTGAGFRAARVSPRWLAAGVSQAQVSVRYPSSRGYVLYQYRREAKTITLEYTSCADKAALRMPENLLSRARKQLRRPNTRLRKWKGAAFSSCRWNSSKREKSHRLPPERVAVYDSPSRSDSWVTILCSVKL